MLSLWRDTGGSYLVVQSQWELPGPCTESWNALGWNLMIFMVLWSYEILWFGMEWTLKITLF